MTLLEILYTFPFAAGLTFGIFGYRFTCWLIARHQDHVDPLPNGEKRAIGSISRVWIGGLVAVAVVGYVLLQVSDTEKHYVQLGQEMRRCQVEFQGTLTARSNIATENDRLYREKLDLLAELGDAQSIWIGRLINLPGELSGLEMNDQRVIDYHLTVTRFYAERVTRINNRIADISTRQRQLDIDRSNNPLPKATCGQ